MPAFSGGGESLEDIFTCGISRRRIGINWKVWKLHAEAVIVCVSCATMWTETDVTEVKVYIPPPMPLISLAAHTSPCELIAIEASRIRGPHWDRQGLVAACSIGKRCADRRLPNPALEIRDRPRRLATWRPPPCAASATEIHLSTWRGEPMRRNDPANSVGVQA